jgi:7-keto-8-aminopelargonate synthetase-like enzyme
LIELADRYEATVYIDDAHGTGVLGENGGGTSEHFGIHSPRMIHMGTLSKAYGAIGGFIATERYITDILRLSCSAYGFTSTLPPDQAFAVSEAIEMVRDEPERRQRLWDNQRHFVSRVQKLGYRLVSKETPIIPLLIGDEQQCDRFALVLKGEGFHVDAVKFPAVPLKQARLRFIMNAHHTREQIDRLVDVLDACQHQLLVA